MTMNVRLWFGFTGSPYNTIRSYYHAEEFVLGDHFKKKNPFCWDRIIINCIGQTNFDPRLLSVIKWDDLHNRLAGVVVTFVDDAQISGAKKEHTWQVGQRFTQTIQHLGLQSAPRKIRPPMRKPGAWSGGGIETTNDAIYNFVTQTKWEKTKTILNFYFNLHQQFIDNLDQVFIDFKQLGQDRGFHNSVLGTYNTMVPYLKGAHQTLDSYRPDRDSEVLKMKIGDWRDCIGLDVDDEERDRLLDSTDHIDYPSLKKICPVPRLWCNI